MIAYNLAAGSVNFRIESMLMEFTHLQCVRNLPKGEHRIHSAARH
jgi:hypothetical protein